MRKVDGESAGLACLYYDSSCSPSFEKMVADYGSMEGYQKALTLEWIKRIKLTYAPETPVLFAGQSKISFIRAALEELGMTDAQIVLVDCDDESRKRRLTDDRKQPDLANDQMMNWAEFLRREKQRAGVMILDTSHQSVEESVAAIKAILSGCR